VNIGNRELGAPQNIAPTPQYNAQRCEHLNNHKNLKKHIKKDFQQNGLQASLNKARRARPVSIRIDRFGRIAYDKNKELS